MKIKMIFIFLLTILIPTSFLAYFGLLAVRSEQSIIEKNIKQRYEAIADIVAGEIKAVLAGAPEGLLNDKGAAESIIAEQASIFKGQVIIFNREGEAIGAEKELGKPVLSRQIKGFPYTMAVYERYPLLFEKLRRKKTEGLCLYVVVIIFSAFSVLGGGGILLRKLSQEWRLAELKSEFALHLSHDLRSPLTSIRMFSEMLSENRIPSEEKRREYYNIITNESERLTQLANNVLDFSRIEQGRKKYNFKRENIVKAAAETVDRFRTYILDEDRHIAFEVKRENDKSANQIMIKIDTEAVSSALMNLLSNAAKYSSPDEEIKVSLKGGKKEVIIEVADRGIGIPAREQKKIFHKFYRIFQKQAAETEGSGLGLTLVKYTAEAHGGRVKVESEEGKGSKFSLILPL